MWCWVAGRARPGKLPHHIIAWSRCSHYPLGAALSSGADPWVEDCEPRPCYQPHRHTQSVISPTLFVCRHFSLWSILSWFLIYWELPQRGWWSPFRHSGNRSFFMVAIYSESSIFALLNTFGWRYTISFFRLVLFDSFLLDQCLLFFSSV